MSVVQTTKQPTATTTIHAHNEKRLKETKKTHTHTHTHNYDDNKTGKRWRQNIIMQIKLL